MNKKLAAALGELGLTVDKNTAYGVVKGYEVSMRCVNVSAFNYGANVKPWQFHFSFYATDEQKRSMESALRNAAIKFCDFSLSAYGLKVMLTDMTVGKFVKRLPSLIDLFTSIISENGGLTSERCPVCGNELPEDAKQYTIDGFKIKLDENCVEKINEVINAENEDFENAPNNYLRGFMGALVGGAAGAAVAILLYFIGFYASISAIVSVVLGVALYQKFGGKPTKMMLLIVSATTVACMALSVFLIYLIAAGVAASQEGLTISAMEAFSIVMKDPDVARSFYVDMAMILLFSAIGIVVQIVYAARKIKRQDNIK